MGRVFGKGTVCYVEMKNGAKYVFRSKLKSGLRNDFGQVVVTDFNSLGVTKVVYAPQWPKPRRGTVEDTAENSETSFVADAKLIGFPGTTNRGSKFKTIAIDQPRQRLVYVTINGIKYGWYLNKSIADGALSALGIEKATANDLKDIFIGCDFPKPPKVKNMKNKEKRWATFCDPSKLGSLSLPDWKVVDNGLTEIGQLAQLMGEDPSGDDEEAPQGSLTT